jgi:hypothetical protein
MGGIEGIARLARTHRRKFSGHRLAENDCAGGARQRHTSGIGAGLMPAISARAVARRHVGGIHDVLDADRHAMKRSPRLCLVAGARFGECLIGV